MMLTFESVLGIFSDYLKKDKDLEVISTKHGYAALLWDSDIEDWSSVQLCRTPKDLFDRLLGHYQTYLGVPFVKDHGSLTLEDRVQIDNMCLSYLEQRNKLE